MHAQPIPPTRAARRPAAPDGPHRPRRPAHQHDLVLSVAMALAAVPLCLGAALAAGAPLRAGLIAAAVAGLVMGGLGRAPFRAAGPAVALTAVTAELIQRYGWRATCAITVLAGLVQVALGAARVARSAPVVAPGLVHGALAGLGLTLALGQVRAVLGGGSTGASTLENLAALPSELAHPRLAGVLIGASVVAVLVAWPKLPGRYGRWARTVPAPLAAVAVATAASTGMRLPRVSLPAWQVQALPGLPSGPGLAIAAAVLTVALVASVEAWAPADDRRPEHPDRELICQGAANALSGLLGGLPIAGDAARAGRPADGGPAVNRTSVVLYGIWVPLGAVLFATALERIPLVALSALVMAAGLRLAHRAHTHPARDRRARPLYLCTFGAVALCGVLPGLAAGGAVAAVVGLRRLARTGVAVTEEPDGHYRVVVDGQLTFLAVPRLCGALDRIPEGVDVTVELGGSFMDHTAYDALRSWADRRRARGSRVALTGRPGRPVAEPVDEAHACRPWTPWRNHHCTRPTAAPGAMPGGRQLIGGVSAFQRNTAPLVRDELARLAREGQRPSQLFLTCADSRLVTSMITSSGPGDLFTVRNVGNLMPPPGNDTACDSVAAAVEYAVEVLKVSSITVCGHSGCGAMQALLDTGHRPPTDRPEPGRETPLARWLRHGRPSLARMQRIGRLGRGEVALADRPVADDVERLALVNVMQQLDHLRAHSCVARRVAEGTLHLQGMYFHVAEAQAYVLDQRSRTFAAVRPEVLDAV
ncbi:SulP family inorganic anion transporter [Streptomyces sp. I05A-00742]|uniref:SulP family inorganic anion transporter n=1 Tax=Streptomyces sp. I05A-00742 TaxID=2732853 RepID=UPI00148904EB|nr:SulP family inorganic anion transporter [Streptomyces sp. I05A-00742]